MVEGPSFQNQHLSPHCHSLGVYLKTEKSAGWVIVARPMLLISALKGRHISQEFVASLVYRVSSRAAKATQRNCFKTKTKNKKTQRKWASVSLPCQGRSEIRVICVLLFLCLFLLLGSHTLHACHGVSIGHIWLLKVIRADNFSRRKNANLGLCPLTHVASHNCL